MKKPVVTPICSLYKVQSKIVYSHIREEERRHKSRGVRIKFLSDTSVNLVINREHFPA